MRFITLRSISIRTTFTFPALDHLQLLSDSAVSCAEVLSTINLPTLRSLRIWPSSMVSFRDALVAVNTSCSATAFKELTMFDDNDGDYDTEPIFVTADDLSLLQKFKGLTSLVFTCPFDLTDGDMKNIAARWPQLVKLSLGTGGWVMSHLTMNGVLSVVKGCPGLSYLCLAFHALQPADFDPKGCCNRRIKTLGVADSPVEGEHQDIADRLASVFPELDTIEASRYDALAQTEWDVVQFSLPTRAP